MVVSGRASHRKRIFLEEFQKIHTIDAFCMQAGVTIFILAYASPVILTVLTVYIL